MVETDRAVSAFQSPTKKSGTECENEPPGSTSVAPLPTLLDTTPVLGPLLLRAERIYSEEWAQSQGKFLSLCKSKFRVPPYILLPAPSFAGGGQMGLGWE